MNSWLVSEFALVADGSHARTHEFTSLAVLAGAIGVWLGFPLLDLIVRLGIGAAILGIVWKSTQDMWHRMLNVVDPEIHVKFKHRDFHVFGVMDVHKTVTHWVGCH